MDIKQFETYFTAEMHKGLPGIDAHRQAAPTSRMPIDYNPEPPGARKSAVLILLFEEADELKTVLFKRTEDSSPHSGQISFPGGKKEDSDESIEHTALRETEEEVGVKREIPQVLGRLTPIYIPVSNFTVQPIVATLATPPAFVPNASEVQTILTPSLAHLFDPANQFVKRFERNQHVFDALCINYQGYTIWGATAIILAELGVLYARVKTASTSF